MPDLDFDAKHKTTSVFDMDKLTLQKDEKARIAIMDQKAKMQLCHYIMDGSVNQKGEVYGRYYVCLGDYATVMKDSSDSERCPACKVAEPGRNVSVAFPRRRFALHIARYRTNAKGQVITPISLALQVWVFSDDKFNKLVDRHAEHGDLRQRDIVLTCTAQQYQTYDMDVSAKLLLKEDASAKAQYIAMAQERSPEVDRLLGQPLSFEKLEALCVKAIPSAAKKEEDYADVEAAAAKAVLEELTSADVVTPAEAGGPLAETITEETPTIGADDTLDFEKLLA